MIKLSIAILDDEERLLTEYESKINEWLKRNNIPGQIVIATSNPSEFIRVVKDNRVNVCIMDINLRGEVNGMYLAKLIRKEQIPVEIVFITGHLEYMPQAFDVHAYNFVPKPFTQNNQMEKILVKLYREMEARASNFKKKIEIKSGPELHYIPVDDILYIDHLGSKTIIHTKNKQLSCYDTLEDVIIKISDDKFKRCHRSIAVNTDHVEFLDIKNKALVLVNGEKCEVGPSYYKSFQSTKGYGE